MLTRCTPRPHLRTALGALCLASLLSGIACTPTPATGPSNAQLAELEEARLAMRDAEKAMRDATARLDAATAKIEVAAAAPPQPPPRPVSPDLKDPFATTDAPTQPFSLEPGAIACANNRCTIKRSLLERIASDPSAVSRAARVIPALRDGAVTGFKLYGIRANSLIKQLGFENGDLVTAVGGHPLLSVDDALRAYTAVKDLDQLDVAFLRKEAEMTLTLVIEGERAAPKAPKSPKTVKAPKPPADLANPFAK